MDCKTRSSYHSFVIWQDIMIGQKEASYHYSVADLGEVPPPLFLGKKRKKSQKEDETAGQSLHPPQLLKFIRAIHTMKLQCGITLSVR